MTPGHEAHLAALTVETGGDNPGFFFETYYGRN
jgi:hypothetical protein